MLGSKNLFSESCLERRWASAPFAARLVFDKNPEDPEGFASAIAEIVSDAFIVSQENKGKNTKKESKPSPVVEKLKRETKNCHWQMNTNKPGIIEALDEFNKIGEKMKMSYLSRDNHINTSKLTRWGKH